MAARPVVWVVSRVFAAEGGKVGSGGVAATAEGVFNGKGLGFSGGKMGRPWLGLRGPMAHPGLNVTKEK